MKWFFYGEGMGMEWFFYGWFIGLGCGVVWARRMFRQTIEMKANTGIRLECAGRLYTIQRVEIEQ